MSVAALWEMRIEQSLGKLDVPNNFRSVLAGEPLAFLPVQADHADAVGGLPHHHRDPFDRMPVAQAQCEGMSPVTHDGRLAPCGIPIIRV